MKPRAEAWYRNPFRVGGLGMLALLGGYLLLREASALGDTAALRLFGRLAYFVGLLMVGVAAIMWFVQARAPEQPIQTDTSEEAAPDDDDDDSEDYQ